MKFKFFVSLSILLLLISCNNRHNDLTPFSFSYATQEAFKAAVDAAFDDAEVTDKAGISVSVYKGGYCPWSYAKGNASGAISMSADTPTFAFSITKTMISALVLTQIEEGLYSLTDTVEDLLQDQADYSSFDLTVINKDATVAQLLSHTSGMKDYQSNIAGQLAMCNPAFVWKPAIILNLVTDSFSGNAYLYSNTNYILLGMIAEHKSGSDLNTLLRSTFFDQLNIEASLAPQDTVPSDIAHPYDDAYIFGAGAPLGTFMDLTVALFSVYPSFNFYLGAGRGTWAAGGIIATADNLAKWGYELYDEDGEAITSSVRTVLLGSATTDNAYGYGINYNTFTYSDGKTGRKYGHGGSAPGYKTLLRYDTGLRMSVAIITNANNSVDGTKLVDRETLANAIFSAYKANNNIRY